MAQTAKIDLEFVERLEKKHKGKWILLLDGGGYVTGDTEESAMSKVPKGRRPIGFFHSVTEDDLFLL